MNRGKVLALAGNQSTVADVGRALTEAGYRFDCVLHMDGSWAHAIADYVDLAPFAAEIGARVLRPASYAMNDDATRALFAEERIDLVVSVGWQRLFPGWFLRGLSIGAFGMHGSALPLPRGRGRSPMNWSIIEGRDRFYTNLFRYDEGVDSGAVVGTQRFDVTQRDTIRSLQHKNAQAQTQLLLRHLPALLDGTAQFVQQPDDVKPSYYPKREPEDGVLDWRDATLRIDRIVRAVARPYPGAFTFCEGKRINVWEGAPFDTHLRFDEAEPGEIVAAFHDGTFVVRTADASYYVTQWDGPQGWEPRPGMRLESRTNASWAKLDAMYEEYGRD